MSQKKQHISEDELLEEAISPIVNRLIDKNFENSGDKIASQMAPLIGGAIREQIKSQKDDVVDALYPVMGNMISKFVTKSLEDLLNKINTQIQNGLSTETIKRKIKAKIKGVSETELLLQENTQAKIKAVLLIHKESGTLLSQVEDKQNQLNDPDMLASMMTAIRSFVNEWVDNDDIHSELGEIEYGGNKIIIEASGYSYLAVIIHGVTSSDTYEKIRCVLEDIVLTYGEEIKKFNGNFDKLPKEELKQKIQILLNSDMPPEKISKNKHPLIYVIPILLMTYFIFIFYNDYVDAEIEDNISSTLEQIPALAPYKIDVDVEDKIVTIKGKVPFQYHKNLTQNALKNIKELVEIRNDIVIIPTLTDPLQVSANIAYFLTGLNQDKNTNLTYIFDYDTLILRGEVKNKDTKDYMLKELEKIKGIRNIIDDEIKFASPSINKNIYFKLASSKLSDEEQIKLLQIATKLKEFDSNHTIMMKSFSDMIGDKQNNRVLAKRRIDVISDILKNQGNLQNPIKIKIYDTPPPEIDATKEPQKARVVNISLKNGQR